MTHEEELIELLDKETTAKKCGADLSAEQKEAIRKVFDRYGVSPKLLRTVCGPQLHYLEHAVENAEMLQCRQGIEQEIVRAFAEQQIRAAWQDGNVICLEVPNGMFANVFAGELFRSSTWRNSQEGLPLMLGKRVDGEIMTLNLAKKPGHLLIAGATGGFKPIFMYSNLLSLMFKHTPEELKLILIDPRAVVYGEYENSPYLMYPVIKSTEDALDVLQWLTSETCRRFLLLRLLWQMERALHLDVSF